MSRKKKLLGFDLDELIQSSVDVLFESQMSDKTGDELDELLNQQKMVMSWLLIVNWVQSVK